MEAWHVIMVVGLVIAGGMIALPMLNDDKDDDNNTPVNPTPKDEVRNNVGIWYSIANADEFDVNNYNDVSYIWSNNLCIGFKLYWDRIEYQSVGSTTIDRVLLYSVDKWELVNYNDITMLLLTSGTSRIEIPCVIFKQDPNGDWGQCPKFGVFYTEEEGTLMYPTILQEGYNCATVWDTSNNSEFRTNKEWYYEWEAPENGMYKLPKSIVKKD